MSKRLDALERRVSQRSSSIGVFLSRSTRRKWLPPRDDDRMALAGAPLQHGRGRSMSHRVRRYGGRARRAATPLQDVESHIDVEGAVGGSDGTVADNAF